MLVELGTPRPLGRHDDPGVPEGQPGRPVITYMRIPDDLTFDRSADASDWRAHLQRSMLNPGGRVGITNYPDAEVLCQLTHPNASFASVSETDPTWAWSDDPDVAR